MVKKLFILFFVPVLLSPLCTRADVLDPLDPFNSFSFDVPEDELDNMKTPDQLIADATVLIEQERVLDARTKLLKALQKDPKSYRAHMMLSGYYLVHVGHFRLALKYIKQAQALFEEAKGKPPYKDPESQNTHAQLLYSLSQIRLNLDNYQGALDVLDEFTSWKYYGSWYPGTRAWVLMKLGRIEDAIRVARLGVLAGAEPGRTLNMLGILLSMHGERRDSLNIFEQAIKYELSLGSLGQPATPLNNTGEVFKEIFEEEKAESSWLKATSLPDGCEHVLPSLNLSLLYFEQANVRGAKRAIDSFLGCVAQFPLRNGEEHRALVALARGRMSLLSGDPQEGIKQLRSCLEDRQWFGKIGTSEQDLEAAAHLSLAQAYEFRNNRLERLLTTSTSDWLSTLKERSENAVLEWWHYRRARQVLTEQLNDFEDLYVRSTDSLIEYPTLGGALAGLPSRLLERKIETERTRDDRLPATPFYSVYLAENYLAHGRTKEGLKLLNDTIPELRPKFDDLLLIHSLALILRTLDVTGPEYGPIVERLYSLSRPAVRNYGIFLPVNSTTSDSDVTEKLMQAGFYVDNSQKRMFSITVEYANNDYTLSFVSTALSGGNVKVTGPVIEELINKLADTIFIEDLGS